MRANGHLAVPADASWGAGIGRRRLRRLVLRLRMMAPPVDGIVLAAGRSRRLGQSKPLLRVRGPRGLAFLPGAGEGREQGGAEGSETFLERAVRVLREAGCRSVTVVVAADDDPVRRLARALGATVVDNAEPDSEPIDSVHLAVASLPEDSAAAVVLPVDVPLVNPGTVAAVVEAFARRRAPIVAPSYRGELGHPVLIARPLFRSVLTEPLEQGLRSLLEHRRDEIESVRVEDPGTLIDIDTAEDYDNLVVRGDFETT